MTTIGFRFEDRITSPPKQSFLQKLNEKQGALVAHIRLNRNEDQAYRRQKHAEQSRQRALSSSSTVTVASLTPSNGSAATDRDSDGQDESDSSPTEDFSVPHQYASMPKDRESRRKMVDGMQNLIIWKQAAIDSDLARPFHISLPQKPQSSHSWSSLSSTPTDMSDEQLDDWLERPMDADLHRELHRSRQASAASSRTSSTASISARPSISSIGEECIESAKTTSTQEIRRKPLPSPPMEVLPEIIAAEDKPLPAPPTDDVSVEDDTSKPLPIPDELLQEIAFQSHDSKARPFRLSRDLLGDFDFSSLPT